MMKTPAIATVLVSAFLLAACAGGPPHKISEEDMSSEWSGQKYANLMVVAGYNDRATRISIETTLAEELTERGIQSAPSYSAMPDLRSISDPNALSSALSAGGHDAFLVVKTIDEPEDFTFGDYMGMRGTVYLLGGEPGAATDTAALLSWATSGLYTLYVGVWDGSTYMPTWQISTDSAVTDSVTGDVRALADLLAPKLREKGLY